MALAVVTLAFFIRSNSGLLSDGPLDLGDGASISSSPASLGERVAWSHNQALNTGEDVVTITAAYLYIESEGQHPAVSEVFAANLTPWTTRFTTTKWPNEEIDETSMYPVEGYKIEPSGRAYFTFIVDVESEGVWFWQKMILEYTYQGNTYSESIDNALKVCAPARAPCMAERP